MNDAVEALAHPQADDRMQAIRHDFVTALIEGLTFVLLVLMIIIGISAYFTGWLPVYTVQAVCDYAFFIAYVYRHRHRLPYNAKVVVLFVMLLVGGISGLPTLGLEVGSITWLLLAACPRPPTLLCDRHYRGVRYFVRGGDGVYLGRLNPLH
jgi:hypothetical protein